MATDNKLARTSDGRPGRSVATLATERERERERVGAVTRTGARRRALSVWASNAALLVSEPRGVQTVQTRVSP